MSKEAQARDVALSEYNKFMDKYKAGVEAGNMKLMQHMLRLEADKIRTQSILDAIEKSEAGIDSGVYDFEESKMKIQMDSEEYARDQAREQALLRWLLKIQPRKWNQHQLLLVLEILTRWIHSD